VNKITKVYHQPGSDIPVLGEWDVIVVGGGPSGCAAAIAAARRGAKTLLVEKYAFLRRLTHDAVCLLHSEHERTGFPGDLA
jgi:NADPH-dependent 2,4-dienoyl-CoA reductase/sulfur reductase-like enzyme